MDLAAQVKRLRLKYPGNRTLLFDDLSLSVREGEKVLLLGPSGCGKSTLLQVLAGIIPRSIEIPLKYEGIVVPEHGGYVFQDPDSQFCMPYVDEEIAFVLENLRIPREEMPALIQRAVELVGLQLPHLHTPIQSLSQGMKQRLAIACVLALQCNVLFLDEPTALLDPEGTEQVWQTIKSVGKDKTMLIIEHRIERIVDFVDRIIVFNVQGEIIADGDKRHIFTDCKSHLIEYGIWYPGVWDDYAERSTFFSRKADRVPSNFEKTADSNQTVISLLDFQGFRDKEVKIRLSEKSVSSGEWIAVTGENGAGKSTLLLALMQLIRTKGDYFFQHKRVAKTEDIVDGISFVFQNPEFQFVTNSVFEEIAYSLRIAGWTQAEIDNRVNEFLSFFDLPEEKERHPYQLSMGQKRRLSVAAAMVRGQHVLLLDEPTFGQDAKNTFAILEKIERLRQEGTTVFMVTHDTEIVNRFATREWTVAAGTVVSDRRLDGQRPNTQNLTRTTGQVAEEPVCS